MQLFACLEIWKRYFGLTYESPLAKKRSVSAKLSWTEMAFLNAVSFSRSFLQSNWLKIQIHWETLWSNSYITHWHAENSSLPANLNRCTLPYLCTVAFATTASLFSFFLMRNVYKCTKPLLAAKTSLGLPWQTATRNVSRSQDTVTPWGTGWKFSSKLRIVWVTCNVTVLRYAVMLQVWTHL